MEQRLVAVLGTTAKHILGGLRHALRAVALTFLIVALLAAAVTEVVASFLTHSFPTGETHLAAAAIAIAFGYAAAITVAIEEILRAIIKAVELIVEEAERVEKKAVAEIEVLGRRAEEQAERLGRAAAADAGAFGHSALSDAGALGRAVAGATGSVIGGLEHDARAVEHGIGAHMPGRHNAVPAPASSSAATLPSVDSTQR